MPDLSVTIQLPSQTIQWLQQSAQQQKQTVPDLVRKLLLQATPPTPALPADLERELLAFADLSDEVLWAVARSTLSASQQARLAELNELGGERPLTPPEQTEQNTLAEAYGRLIVRRGEAAVQLKRRGYDLSNPQILQVAAH